MHQTLYRKYRPTVFDDVYGQDHITSVLKYETETGRTSHAYLFCGSRGTGKTTCAKILAKAVNCEHPVNGNPCCACPSCLAVDSGAATDVLEMDAASNNGVDYIRDLRDEVVYTPAMLKKRVYIIDEVHMLSTSAFNALLKTLEEPPEHVIFILATTELQKLPATIISRCQRFDFHRIPVSLIADRLMFIAEKEGISMTRRAAELLAKQAQGGMRDAISLFELCSSGASVAVDEERVNAVLGLSSYARLAETVSHLADRNIPALFSTIADLVASSKDITVFWQELQAFYRDMMVNLYAGDPGQYLDLPADDLDLLTAAASRFSLPLILQQAGLLDTAYQNMLLSPQTKRMTAEFTLVRMCDPRLDTSPEALLARVTELEDRVALLSVGRTPELSASPATADVPAAIQQPVVRTPEKLPARKVVPPAPVDDGYTPVDDLSEVVDRISRVNASVKDFLADCRLSVSADGNTIRVQTANQFALVMLSADANRKLLSDSLAVCRIASPGAMIEFVKQAEQTEDPLAALPEF